MELTLVQGDKVLEVVVSVLPQVEVVEDTKLVVEVVGMKIVVVPKKIIKLIVNNNNNIWNVITKSINNYWLC